MKFPSQLPALFLSALAFVPSCVKKAKPSSEVSIFGGQDVASGPILKSTVALRVDEKVLCSGTVVSNDLIVSAGHCNPYTMPYTDKESIENREASAKSALPVLNAAFGPSSGTPAATRKIVGVVTAPEFVPLIKLLDQATLGDMEAMGKVQEYVEHKYGWHDISLWRFEGGLPEEFAAARLTGAGPALNAEVTVAGFGITELGREDNGTLRSVVNKVSGVQEANQEFSMDNSVRGICIGDSGGPVYRVEGGEAILVGVTSSLAVADTCRTPMAFFTEVSSHVAWLKVAAKELNGTWPASR